MNPRRPRSPGIVYAGLGLLLFFVIAIVALTATQPPPPRVAEFAPQAQEQIEEAPDEQVTDHGAGAGPGGEGEAEPTPEPPEPEEAPRQYRCVGDPPRQTEDPQAPPCIPFWEGDNGGATHQGVTENEVRIAVPGAGGEGDFDEELAAYFNKRYELYGRQLVLVPIEGGSSTEEMRAAALEADEEHRVFASTMYGDAAGQEHVYYDELARREIVSMNARPTMSGEERYQEHHPYQWSYLPGFDKMSRNKAEWICNSLNGRPAEFAGGDQQGEERTFGLVWSTSEEGAEPDLGPMRATLQACGVEIAAESSMQAGLDDGHATAQNILIQMRSEGVTSIICACHASVSGQWLYPNATWQGYFPEWLVSTYMYQDDDIYAQVFEERQVNSTMGISWWSRQLAPQNSPWYWAVREGDPDRRIDSIGDYYSARWLYNTLLMLVSGIQVAGPELTPETFADGLMSTEFPNPNAGEAPYWQGHVGFSPTDHTAVNDAAIYWMSPTERSNWNGNPGRICYAAGGSRFRLGTWPTDDAGLFEAPCE